MIVMTLQCLQKRIVKILPLVKYCGREEKERDQINPSFGLLGEAKF